MITFKTRQSFGQISFRVAGIVFSAQAERDMAFVESADWSSFSGYIFA